MRWGCFVSYRYIGSDTGFDFVKLVVVAVTLRENDRVRECEREREGDRARALEKESERARSWGETTTVKCRYWALLDLGRCSSAMR